MTEKKGHHEEKGGKSGKKNTTGYLIGAVVVIAVILFLAFGRDKAPTPADTGAQVPAEPSAPAPGEEPSAVPGEPSEAAPSGDKAPKMPAVPSAVTVLEEKTITGSLFDNTAEETESSWFSGISCAWSTSTGEYDDSLTFTLMNNGQKTYYLGRVRVNELQEKDPLRVSVNGHGLRDTVEQECGKVYLKPGESATCTAAADLRKTVIGQEQNTVINKLRAEGANMQSWVYFTC